MKALFLAAFTGVAAAGIEPYSPALGTQFAYLAGAAYCDKTSLAAWDCGEPCSENSFVSKGALLEYTPDKTFGYVAGTKDGGAIVGFRGTQGITNWLVDFDYFPTAYPGCEGCMVHQGFYDSYLGLAPSILANLDALGGKDKLKYVWVTGHSLGGAMATVTGYELLTAGFPVEKVVTFGDPRVGNPAYAVAMHKAYTSGNVTMERAHVSSLSTIELPSPTTSLAKTLLNAPVADDEAAVEAHKALRRQFLSPVLDRVRSEGIVEAIRDNTRANAKSTLRGGSNGAVPAPRVSVGNPVTYYRVTHHHDPVPRVPLVEMGFEHAPQEIWYNEETGLSYVECSATNGEDMSCIDSVDALDLIFGAEDHLNYVGMHLSGLCS